MPSFEKSCGGVIYRKCNEKTQYLLIYNKKGNAMGHWGFPKGHVENDETEIETATREIGEETGLKDVRFIDGFRVVTRYSPCVGVIKDVVYFLAKSKNSDVTIQQSEVADYVWLEYDSAYDKISNDGDKNILKSADDYLAGMRA